MEQVHWVMGQEAVVVEAWDKEVKAEWEGLILPDQVEIVFARVVATKKHILPDNPVIV